MELFADSPRSEAVRIHACAFVQWGGLRLHIAPEFNLKELYEAQLGFLDKHHVGKIVIHVVEQAEYRRWGVCR